MPPEEKERRLRERLERIDALEKDIASREKALKAKEGAKKQVLLRLSPGLWTISPPGRRMISAP